MGGDMSNQIFKVVEERVHQVRFFDYDGTILRSQFITDGASATAPNLPSHPRLTFTGWNNNFSEVKSDLDVGALYVTASGKVELDVTVGAEYREAAFYFEKLSDPSSSLMIDWGDGQSTTQTATEIFWKVHAYDVQGSYTISVYESTGAEFIVAPEGYYFDMSFCLNNIFMNSNAKLVGTFYSSDSPENLEILQNVVYTKSADSGEHPDLESFRARSYHTYETYPPFKHLTIPGEKASPILKGCKKLTTISIGNGVEIVGSKFVTNCISLTKIVFPQSVISISLGACTGCTAMQEYHFTSPQVISCNAPGDAIHIPTGCKIYVPWNLLNAYQTHLNWGVYKNYFIGE